MRGVERSLQGVETATRGAHLQTGRLGNQFANLAGQIAHVHPIVGNLAGVLSTFAVGSLASAGILGGIAAIAVLYDKITESSRKAKEQTDKFIASLVSQARAAREATIAGAEFNQLVAETELQEAKKASGIGVRSILGSILTGKPGLASADIEAASKRIADAQTGVEQSIIRTTKAYENANKPLKETVNKTAELTFRYDQLREAAARVNAEMAKDTGNFWRGYIEQIKAALTLTQQLEARINAARPSLLDAFESIAVIATPNAGMPNISMPFEGLTEKQKENLKQLGIITEDANRNADNIQQAIWGSASQLANTLVSALNIGGGGKGSNLGGAIGSTAGFALGFAFGGGPVGGAIGSLIGNIGGSFLGGLFDNKKATDINTAAIRANTAALLQNAPNVYKVARGRFDATEVKEFRRSTIRYATRGGAPVMVVP